MFARLWLRIKKLWQRAKSERATPREIFWAVFLGAFIGCTPAVGLRPWIALAVATVLKKNRLFCYLGSHTSNIVFMPFVAVAEVQVAHRIRVGEWVQIDRQHAVDQAGEFLLDWCIGCIPVGLLVATVLGLLGYWIAVTRDRRRRAREMEITGPQQPIDLEALRATSSPRRPTEAPPPSSESPA